MIQTTNFLAAQHQRVAVMTSGGLDSALLLYLIVKEAADKGRQVTSLTIPGSDGAELHGPRIAKTVEQLSGIPVLHELLNPTNSSDLRVSKGVTQAILQQRYNAVFLATTAVPSHLKDVQGVPARPPSHHPVIQPWLHNTKYQIVEYCRRWGLEALILASHSCTVQQQGHCGQCWNCRERRWVIG